VPTQSESPAIDMAMPRTRVGYISESSTKKECGGYFSCLDRDGSVYDTDKFIWLQGREVWLFSMLCNKVENRPEWLKCARQGGEFLRKYGHDGNYDWYALHHLSLGLSRFSRMRSNVRLAICAYSLSPEALNSLVDSFEGRTINPGHSLEAMWFVMDMGVRLGRRDLIDRAVEIALRTIEYGWDKQYGGIFYFMDRLGHPQQQLEWDQKLWWVHLESAIAMLKGYQLTGNRKCLAWFEKLDQYMWSHFKDAEYPEWFGYLNRRGEVLLPLKDDVVLLDGREFVEGTAPRVVGLVDAQRVGFCCGGVRHGRGDYDG